MNSGSAVCGLLAAISCSIFYLSSPVSGESCASVVPTERLECGFQGITETQCLNDANCCYDSSVSGVKWCYIDPNKNPCVSTPCKNGGTCKPIDGNNFQCQCASGFSGETCDIGVCDSSPCKNGGSCSPDISGFQCSCASGFTGDTCDTVSTDPALPPECTGYPYFTRSAWYARESSSTLTELDTPVDIVIVHDTNGNRCSNKDDCMEEMRRLQAKAIDVTGKADIQYNFCVAPGGGVYEGRGWDNRGVATNTVYNPKSIQIAVMGKYETGDVPYINSLESLKKHIMCGVKLGKISPDFHLYGHQDVDCAVTCPGIELYKKIKTWTGTYRYGGKIC